MTSGERAVRLHELLDKAIPRPTLTRHAQRILREAIYCLQEGTGWEVEEEDLWRAWQLLEAVMCGALTPHLKEFQL